MGLSLRIAENDVSTWQRRVQGCITALMQLSCLRLNVS
jgi:hypothetical protein